jgi:CubicO group peptidase (beta-lactamase class C family)
MDLDRAAAYHAKHAPQALLVYAGEQCLLERYDAGFDASAPHALYSGTKSFWGVAALAAQADGLLSLDEPVAQTIASWKVQAWKARVTLRQLLTLSAGIGFGGLGNAVPQYEKALAVELKTEPGTTFTYGGIPLQVFGAVLARKVAAKSPHDYLRERVLEPAEVHIASWRRLKDGTQPLPTGAFLTAPNWAAYGRFLCAGAPGVLAAGDLAQCFVPSATNPRYGLGFWLADAGVVYASGSGGQALYVQPQSGVVAVRFGASTSWRHESFLKALL